MNLKCSPTPLQHQNDRPRGGYGAAAAACEVLLAWPASLTPSEASETFSGVFWSFRGLGAAAAACEVFLVPGQTWPASLMPSEASETFSGVF